MLKKFDFCKKFEYNLSRLMQRKEGFLLMQKSFRLLLGCSQTNLKGEIMKIYLTLEGKKELEDKLEYLKTVKREEVIKAIGAAREFGDLSENSEYDAAKEAQAQLESEILEIETKLRDCVIIDKKSIDTSKVSMGCFVKVFDKEYKEEIEYKIVSSTESNPLKGLISNESPVGLALMNAGVGDEVAVQTPMGESKLKVLAIRS